MWGIGSLHMPYQGKAAFLGLLRPGEKMMADPPEEDG
jgi:hypothetical protein